ncbi:alpha-L-rhamnosidase [Arthrobacter sp. cf158]|uniref:alpha-L-rhamnosidase n=1 Tax=Arthrobacter sp. cf158 TaxID=1761744 RepID=UPI00089A38A9|nr:alpha-L-rhamnosidase [Arthrobacter sp. cf158]SDW58005.1 alpha-L-rhamnosidase [Arthrobacter sp. cf158]
MTDHHSQPSLKAALRDASWISPVETQPSEPGRRPAYWLRSTFEWVPGRGRATIHATAHGLYELFINGSRVGDEELTPGFTAYRKRLQVHAWDITGLLLDGANVISVLLSDGWFRGRHGFERRADGFGRETAFIASITSPSGTLAVTDKLWTSRESHITHADLMDGQTIDFRRCSEPEDGTTTDGWLPVATRHGGLYGNSERYVRPVAPAVRRIEELQPVSITHSAPGVTVVDFGQNINGWVRLTELGPEGTRTTLRHGEVLDPAGLVSTENIRAFDFATKTPLPAGQVDEVISAGHPGDVFEPRHTTHGFRYVQIEGLTSQLSAQDITAVVVHTDLTRTGTFRCSDPRINALHDAVLWSFRGNACDVPTDCPQRERSGFTGDWQVFVDTAALMFDVSGFSTKWLKDLAADQWTDGRVPTVVPNPAGAGPSGNFFEDLATGSAGWGDAAVFVPWSLWRAYGDKEALAEAFPSMRSWVDFAAGAAAAGRHPLRAAARLAPLPHETFLWDTGFHFGEWLEPDTPPNPDPSRDHGIVATGYLYRSAELLARTAGVLGEITAAAHYASLAAAVLDAWQAEYLDQDGRLGEESQGHYVRALAFGLVPEKLAPLTASRLVELVRLNGNRLGTGFLSTGLLLPVLADHGYLDVAYQLLLSTGTPSWLGMLDAGATTMWEWWDGVTATGARGSLNHYSKGAAGSFLYTHVAGIRLPENPDSGQTAYRTVTIAPQPGGGLTSARATVETVHGRITSAWTVEHGAFALRIEIPEGVTAVVSMPDGTSHNAPAGEHEFHTV